MPQGMTVIVADTGDLEAIKKHRPVDSTTNPSLVLKALKQLQSEEEKSDEAEKLLKLAVEYAKSKCESKDKGEMLNIAIDRMAVEFGRRILEFIPGYVSTELDARLSFDIDGSVKRAVGIIEMYQELGLKNPRDRVLIKVASTWEGMQVAKILREKYQIKCNMFRLFVRNLWKFRTFLY